MGNASIWHLLETIGNKSTILPMLLTLLMNLMAAPFVVRKGTRSLTVTTRRQHLRLLRRRANKSATNVVSSGTQLRIANRHPRKTLRLKEAPIQSSLHNSSGSLSLSLQQSIKSTLRSSKDPDRVAISQQGLLSILQALEHQQNPQCFKLWPSLSSTISIHLMHSCATASQTGMHTSH